jgi:regulator of replication initiation timing
LELETKLSKVKTQKEDLIDENTKLNEQLRKLRYEKDKIEDEAQLAKERFNRQ